MCKAAGLTLFITFTTSVLLAQTMISGKVITTRSKPVEGVSITVKNSYLGVTSATNGSYSFSVPDTGRFMLLFSITGYKPLEKEIHVSGGHVMVDVQLREAVTELKAVMITAGSFEASDTKRATVLKSIDMVTTAGQQADIVATLKTLPGTQQVGEQEGLFVRGGMGNETRIFVDGMMVVNPFYASVPNIAQRSRFSPLLFKGTVFSSGGYSAQYGQALSAALILESIDLPSRSEVNLIASSAQMSVLSQQMNKGKDASMGFNVNYNNLAPYYSVVRQKYHFNHPPEMLNGEMNFRKKTKHGMLKLFGYASTNNTAFERPSLDYPTAHQSFQIKNYNTFSTLTYLIRFPNNWQLTSGTSFSYNKDRIRLQTSGSNAVYSTFFPVLTNQTALAKIAFSKTFPGLSKLQLGGEWQNAKDDIEAKDSIALRKLQDSYVAGFAESEIYLSSRLASRVGVRVEYCSLLQQAVVSPRASIAYKVSGRSQFSFAYGTFYQKPETHYLFRTASLQLSKASHYILNYQKTNAGQTLRIESFYKHYRRLITINSSDAFDIHSDGRGYARGIEVFWRDKLLVRNLDYWISYSFLDTKRKYLDYPYMVQPPFAARHTASLVAKRWVEKLSTQFSATYSYASGRPYYNPNRPAKEFMRDRTMSYHSVGIQANYLRTFGTINAVFIVNIGNALGSKQVFSYSYASRPDTIGQYNSEAVTPLAKRFIFLGAYLSIGSDRRKTILD